jgi:hypothetical protein
MSAWDAVLVKRGSTTITFAPLLYWQFPSDALPAGGFPRGWRQSLKIRQSFGSRGNCLSYILCRMSWLPPTVRECQRRAWWSMLMTPAHGASYARGSFSSLSKDALPRWAIAWVRLTGRRFRLFPQNSRPGFFHSLCYFSKSPVPAFLFHLLLPGAR